MGVFDKFQEKVKNWYQILAKNCQFLQNIYTCIGDRPVGARGAAATPDKENNLSTRNQKLMKKKFQTRKSVHDA